MNNKMAIHTNISTIKSKKQTKQTRKNRDRIMDTESVLMVTRWQGGVGEWGRGEAIKNKLVVTEYRIARLVTE